ncbi:hypothetical protein ID866_10055 [Astraeus odoratus]|nr:hypothetical protein ID866_10055 [Astraeus odoratus]
MHHPYYTTSPTSFTPSARYPSSSSPPGHRYDSPYSPQSPPTSHPQSPQSHAHAQSPHRSDRSDVSTAVHSLILSMKSIQETLRLWSLSQASPEQVSDCFVQFGVEFNVIVKAFEGYGIGTGDLHPIPASLRTALENLLGEDPSPAVLAMYMPDIRVLFYELLQGLRSKQSAWKAVTSGPASA